MRILVTILGAAWIALILADGFESILQPRRVTRKYRIARFYYAGLWAVWRRCARITQVPRRRAAFLSIFGPLSILGIFAIWVFGLIVGFALLNWGLNDPIATPSGTARSFWAYLYLSGSTFFTLGYGDVTPASRLGKILCVCESGLGFGFLAAILSYLPALFQAYSKREVSISLLDARAGSPPSAAQLLLRSARAAQTIDLDPFLIEWERWSAELLESQLSFPVLGYYRSQHDNQSWLAAIATILDACALLLTQVNGINTYQAQVTFAISRHAVVDLVLVLRASLDRSATSMDRLSSQQLQSFRQALQDQGIALRDANASEAALRNLQGTYEPFLHALAERLILTLPPIVNDDPAPDNWQRSAWMRPAPGIGALPIAQTNEEHFAG